MIRVALLTCFLFFSTVLAKEPAIDEAIDSLVTLMLDSSATEYRKARTIHHTQNQMGKAFVLFTIEGFGGGNNYTFYLAAFEPSWVYDSEKSPSSQNFGPTNIAKYRLIGYLSVGGNGIKKRGVDFSRINVEENKLTLFTKEDGRNGSVIEGEAVYLIEENRISELNNPYGN